MKTRGLALALFGALAITLVTVAPAAADSTSIRSTSSPVVAVFGEPWKLEFSISGEEGGFSLPIGESSGSVDVFIEQLPGVFLEDLAVQANGSVFVTQPPDKPFLAPGTYDVRAVFTPASGTGLKTAQVRVPAAITITPLELAATIAVQADSSVTNPRISVSLATAGEASLGALPPGVWNLTVREASGNDVLYSRQVLQTTSFEPLVIETTASFRPDVDHVLLAEFVPVAEFAAGVVVTGTGEIAFRTAPQDIGQFLVTPIDVPVWALVLALVGLLAGVSGLVTSLIVRARRAHHLIGPAPADDAASAGEDGARESTTDEGDESRMSTTNDRG